MDSRTDIPPKELEHLKATIGNKLWRMTHLYKIVNKTTKALEFLKPNPIQLMMYDSVKDRTRLREFYLKYRQGGVSTWWLLWWLDEAIFKENTNCGILSHKKESLDELWGVIGTAYDSMPARYKPRHEIYNKSTLSFPDVNSKIFVSLSIRSTRVDNLHISEACLAAANDIRASKAAVPPQGNITIESTANGMGNEGYFMYQEAKTGENGYRAMFFPWWIQPEYRLPLNGAPPPKRTEEEKKLPLDDEQVMFRRYQKREQKELFPQEYAEDDITAFLSTGNPFFDNRKVMALLKEARTMNVTNPPIEETDAYTIWEEPQVGHRYAIGADVAEGVENDYSCFKVLCVTCRREAMRYHAHVSLKLYYKDLDHWGRKYNRALLGVERNNHGHAILLGLSEDCKYPNLYQEVRSTPIFMDSSKPKPEPKLGWGTSEATKQTMCQHLKWAIEGDPEEDAETFQPDLIFTDEEFLSECLTFHREGVKLTAVSGKHDDTVIAAAIAYQMYIEVKSKTKTSDLEKAFMSGPRIFN